MFGHGLNARIMHLILLTCRGHLGPSALVVHSWQINNSIGHTSSDVLSMRTFTAVKSEIHRILLVVEMCVL